VLLVAFKLQVSEIFNDLVNSIATICYSDNIEKALGTIEGSVGTALVFGPFIGSVLFMIGGFVAPFFGMGMICH
jgi:hypothetical protein